MFILFYDIFVFLKYFMSFDLCLKYLYINFFFLIYRKYLYILIRIKEVVYVDYKFFNL